MIYQFLKFKLNTSTQELYFTNQKIALTKQNYKLLLYLLENNKSLSSKTDLVNTVWDGRVVADNTIDKSITKLKKILNKYSHQDYFETQYGKGIRLLPEVVIHSDKFRRKYLYLIASLIIVIILLNTTNFSSKISDIKTIKKHLLLILPNKKLDNTTHWWSANNHKIIENVLAENSRISIMDFNEKPKNLDIKHYLKHLWIISPQLKVLKTSIKKSHEEYQLDLVLTDNIQNTESINIKNKDYNNLIKSAHNWLSKKITNREIEEHISFLNNSTITENYLRGLQNVSDGKLEKAEKYFDLCLLDNPNFHLCTLDLARVKHIQGNNNEALAQINSLLSMQIPTIIALKANILQGDIYLKTNEINQAKAVYQNIINNYANNDLIMETKLKLSQTYSQLNKKTSAIKLLDDLIASTPENYYAQLLAEAYENKAVVLENLGELKFAKTSINKAKVIYNKLGDIDGEAKVYKLLAKISQQENNYTKATLELNHALGIDKVLQNNLNIAETVSSLIKIHYSQGQFNKVLLYSRQLYDMSIINNFSSYKLIATIYLTKSAIIKKQWGKAQLLLDEYTQLSLETNNFREIVNNKLLYLDFLLESNNYSEIPALINHTHAIINENNFVDLQIQLDEKFGNYYYAIKQSRRAISLLTTSLFHARKSNDIHTIISTTLLLTKIHLSKKEAISANKLLISLESYSPFAYPYLLLKSKTQQTMGHLLHALELANKCKRQANDFWQKDDENYLNELISLNKNHKKKNNKS